MADPIFRCPCSGGNPTLKLPAVAEQVADLALRAAKANLTHEAFLYELLQAEVAQREQHRIARLRRRAGLPAEKTFRTLQLERFPVGCENYIRHRFCRAN